MVAPVVTRSRRWRSRDGTQARSGLLNRYNARRMDPLVHIPSVRPTVLRVPPALAGLRAACLQPVLGLAPEREGPVQSPRSRSPGAAATTPSPSCPARSAGRDFSTTPTSSRHTTRSSRRSIDTWPTATITGSSAVTRNELTGPIAYFCAEYGIHESLGIYSGGLGVLAGRPHEDRRATWPCRSSASACSIGSGYFRQTIDADGHQEHAYPDYDLIRLPLTRALDRTGDPLTVAVELPGRDLFASPSGWPRSGASRCSCWTRTSPRTTDSDRPITHILYVRGREMRLHQELVLGRRRRPGPAGPRASRRPSGTSTRATPRSCSPSGRARLVAAGATLDDAWREVRRNSVFTIHTPVSAGNERFDADLVRRDRRARCSKATAGPTRAACRSIACSSSASASDGDPASST